jgi:HK97 gp10 family phage protein
MAKNPLIRLEGADALNKALRDVGARAGGLVLRRAAEAGGAVIKQEAQRLAPVDEGDLRDGITAEPGRLQQGRAQINVGVGKNEWYGKLVELGTEKMAAQPFLRPAFDTKAEEATEAVRDVLRDSLKDVLS